MSVNDVYEINHIWTAEMKSNEGWSSQLWTQFMQSHKEVWKKFRTSTGFEPVTSRYRCDALTNWAMKPLTLEAGYCGFICSRERDECEWCIWNKSWVETLLKSWIFFQGFFMQLHKLCSQLWGSFFISFHSPSSYMIYVIDIKDTIAIVHQYITKQSSYIRTHHKSEAMWIVLKTLLHFVLKIRTTLKFFLDKKAMNNVNKTKLKKEIAYNL